ISPAKPSGSQVNTQPLRPNQQAQKQFLPPGGQETQLPPCSACTPRTLPLPDPCLLSQTMTLPSSSDICVLHNRVQLAEMISGWEMNNVYTVKNTLGQQVFVATEENDVFTMQACGQEILTLARPLRCTMCCFPCCLQELEVRSPPGNPIGFVEQNWHPVLSKFTILNETRNLQLKITGPFCDCNCMSDTTFEVTSLDESTVVGQIRKQCGGFIQQGFTDTDNFMISFPLDLDVKIKAVMLGACFLIDFMFYENKPKTIDERKCQLFSVVPKCHRSHKQG
uniref:Phospholipid scramblase n=1 Tax=Hippocampus comes TaxID=109280 RepID=A0A3Q3DEV0_HIPCM